MKYKAFISYRHTENGRHHAVALETALKRYAKPTLSRPMKIFRDEKHMKPDVSLPKLIRDGLENSEFLIFLAEKSSAESQWCGEELEMWCGALKRTQNLIIVLIDDDIALDGTNGILWEKTDALPALLRPYLKSIPLYVDLRWAKSATDTDLQHPKYRHEINALAARLRGVNPEDLNDEEIRVYRRNIRLRNGAIGVLLGMVIIAVGAAWLAMRQTSKAEEALKKVEETFLVARILVAKDWEGNRGIKFPYQVSNTSLSGTISKLKNLRVLNLSDMGLTQLPQDILEFDKLDTLYLAGNNLTTLPSNFGKLQNLKALSLSYNNFKELPAEIGMLQNLQWLDLSNNKFYEHIPIEVLKDLKNIRKIVLSRGIIESARFDNEEVETLRHTMPWCEIELR